MASSKEVVTRSQTMAAAIDPDQTLKASRSLLAHIKKASATKAERSDKKQLLAGDSDDEEADAQPIWLQVTTKRHVADSNRLKPGRIQLPHPINTSEHLSVCVIVADNVKELLRDALDSEDVPADLRKRVGKIVHYSSIVKKYNQYESQRKLYAEHDVFLADDRIINRLPKALGKTFYKTTTKRPLPINIQSRTKTPSTKDRNGSLGSANNRQLKDKATNFATPAQVRAELEKALGSALVSLTPSTNVQVRVGISSLTPEQLAANAAVVAEKLIEKWIPQGWKNIKGIWVKGPETAALPIWQTEELWLSEQDVVADPTEEEKAKIEEKLRKKKGKKSRALLKDKESANVGRKRKAIGEEEEEEEQAEGEGDDDQEEGAVALDEMPPAKKSKKEKKVLPESSDGKLDKQIAERKEKLKKAKAKAKKALD